MKWLRQLVLACASAGVLSGQQPWQFPRVTTGSDTSTLVISDSLHRTRGVTFANLRTIISGSVTTSFIPGVDSAYNIGSASKRFRKGYFADSVFAGVFVGGSAPTFPLQAPSGSATAPSYGFSGGTDTTGIFHKGLDTLAFSTQGTLSGYINAGQLTMQSTTQAFQLIAQYDATHRAFLGAGSTGNAQLGGTNSILFTAGAQGVASFNATVDSLLKPVVDTSTFVATSTGAHQLGAVQFANGVVSGLTSLSGGPNNLTVTAGTGNSRTMTLQTTTSGGTAKNTLVLGADSSTTALGAVTATGGLLSARNADFTANGTAHIKLDTMTDVAGAYQAVAMNGVMTKAGITGSYYKNTSDSWYFNVASGANYRFSFGNTELMTFLSSSSFRIPNLSAEGGTTNALCWNSGASGTVTQNAAATCTVSSARFKQNIKLLPLDSAYDQTMRLRAVTFEEKANGRVSQHVIAEQADSLSSRLTFYDAQHRPNSVDDGAILAAVLRVVQDQQLQLADLKAFKAKACAAQPTWCQ